MSEIPFTRETGMSDISRIPHETIASLERYVKYHIPTGGFLKAVLTNDLMEAIHRADSFNLAALVDIVKYLYNDFPGNCWGSPEKYKEWTDRSLWPEND